MENNDFELILRLHKALIEQLIHRVILLEQSLRRSSESLGEIVASAERGRAAYLLSDKDDGKSRFASLIAEAQSHWQGSFDDDAAKRPPESTSQVPPPSSQEP